MKKLIVLVSLFLVPVVAFALKSASVYDVNTSTQPFFANSTENCTLINITNGTTTQQLIDVCTVTGNAVTVAQQIFVPASTTQAVDLYSQQLFSFSVKQSTLVPTAIYWSNTKISAVGVVR